MGLLLSLLFGSANKAALKKELQNKTSDQQQIIHYFLDGRGCLKKGIPDDIARDFTYSACCTFDLNYHTDRQEHYVPVPQIFVETLHKKDYSSLDELIGEFRNGLYENM